MSSGKRQPSPSEAAAGPRRKRQTPPLADGRGGRAHEKAGGPRLLPGLPPLAGGGQTVDIEGRRLALTNLDKVFWQEAGYSKRDLINYYFRVSAFILPHLAGRPLSLKRYPDGAGGAYFFQKNAPAATPAWIHTERLHQRDRGERVNYIVCDGLPALLYLANLGCISQNPWLSALPHLNQPDIITLDLDPTDPDGFEACIEVALLVKKQLERFGLRGYPKTSGATGIHVYVPVKPRYSYAQCRRFAELIAMLCREERPDLITLEPAVKRRGGKLYLDYMQNVRGKTLASVYSLRARPEAPAAAPLAWQEVRPGLTPADFTIRNMPARLARKGDLFAAVLTDRQDLSEALNRGGELLGG